VVAMKKPLFSTLYDLREVSDYINEKEGTSVDFWNYFATNRDNCRNGSYIRIEDYGEIAEEELNNESWSEEQIKDYRYSSLVYKYFPDADYFMIWW
jgi:hypothetical protein